MSPASPETLKEDIVEIKRQLGEIQRAVNRIAVQDERIKHIETSQGAVWKKYDALRIEVDAIARFQASCPREGLLDKLRHIKSHIHWLWSMQFSLILLILATAFKIIMG